jgi:hypothetical protein
VDAARALDGAAAAPASAAAAIDDVRARIMGVSVEGRLTVRAGGVSLGAASTTGEQPIGVAPATIAPASIRTTAPARPPATATPAEPEAYVR